LRGGLPSFLDKYPTVLRTCTVMKIITRLSFEALMFVFIALSSRTVDAVNPPPDGAYQNYNTAEGQNALFNLVTLLPNVGLGNTAVGWQALFTNEYGSYNTAVGAGALLLSPQSSENTAVGAAALLLNNGGVLNTAVGTSSLAYNHFGSWNTAVGVSALGANQSSWGNCAFGTYALGGNDLSNGGVANGNCAFGFAALETNDDGYSNSAFGAESLQYNVDGYGNDAFGLNALEFNVSGSSNAAFGIYALFSNTGASGNCAFGDGALYNNDFSAVGLADQNNAFGENALFNNIDGIGNVAVGDSAYFDNVNGSFNTVVGWEAGVGVEGDDNIYIGATAGPPSGGAESGTTRIGDPNHVVACYIAGILNNGAFGATVQIDPATGQLGTNLSAERFKKDIAPIDKASEAIFSLRPVTFRYKNDKTNTAQFGLIAEEVGKVNPALIAVDNEGKPYTVRYEQINAMLLNEFLKEHRQVEELKKQVEALTAGLQKVSAQLEVSNAAPHTVLNNQ
jgi:trimeric autotransporter adhesin